MADENNTKVETEVKEEVAEAPVEEAKVEEAAPVEVPKKEESTPAVAQTPKSDSKAPVVGTELEREYVIPLRKGSMKVPRYKRAKKAIKTLKEFLAKHMRVEDRDLRKVKVNIDLNNEVWFRGIKKPLHKIKVKAVKREGIVYAELADVPEVVKFKQARLAKRASKVTAAAAGPTQSQPGDSDKDKDKDGVDDKVEEAEDQKSVAEKSAKDTKAEHKKEKHDAKAKSNKQEKAGEHRKVPKK